MEKEKRSGRLFSCLRLFRGNVPTPLDTESYDTQMVVNGERRAGRNRDAIPGVRMNRTGTER